MNGFCVPAAFLFPSLWEWCFLYLWVCETSLCCTTYSCSIPFWYYGFYTSGCVSVLCAPATFLLPPLWEECFLYFLVCETSVCCATFSCSIPFGNYIFYTSGCRSVLFAPATFLLPPLWERKNVFCTSGCVKLLCVMLHCPVPFPLGTIFSIPLGAWY